VFTRLRRSLALLILPTAVVALVGAASSATASSVSVAAPVVISTPAAPVQGIIMRDGGICDPIRHMGC
jgi:hypothetical protein